MIIIDINKKKAKMYSSNAKKITTGTNITDFGKFTITSNQNNITISNVTLIKSKKNIQISNAEFVDFLKNDTIYLTESHNLFEEFLKSHDIQYLIKQVCSSCLELKTFKLLSDKSIYQVGKKHLCFNCAKDQIISTAYLNDYSDNAVNHFINVLKDTKDLSLVFDLMDNDEELISNPKYSIYDKIESNEESFAKVSIDDIDIPNSFKTILKPKIDYLLPVQILALNAGLLYNENLLIVSQTASGKTLIAELTGIKKALQKKKFVYLSPLVALANQKYRYFKELYSPLGLNVVIKVGSNRINAEDELKIIEKPVDNADIIVATYEGLDFILRSGNKDSLDDLGVVVIDEIHMLENKERGSRLHGLINRLMLLYPYTQLIGLSATVNNSQQLSELFNMKLVEYDKRPITLERHIIAAENKKQKSGMMTSLCKKEFENISPLGYKGQSIIFTDSRRKTNEIAKFLQDNGINAHSYHAGLSYANKVDIEIEYANQEISTVVTTAALAAGVDFPASLVIFDSLRMGTDWLTANEFHQMTGRAGRPAYHDIGKAYILYEIGKNYNYTLEEEVAYNLLKSNVDDIKVVYTRYDIYEQVLADISSSSEVSAKLLIDKYDDMDCEVLINQVLIDLSDKDMIEYNQLDDTYFITAYGRAVSESFLKIHEAEIIRNNITMDLIDLVTELEYFSNVYLSNRLLKLFKKNSYFFVSSRLFSSSTKELLNNRSFLAGIPKKDNELVMKLLMDFRCDCNDIYCDCMEKNISRYIINMRLDSLSPSDIAKEISNKYPISIYGGDIYNYLDQVIRYLESIERISRVFDISSVTSESKKLIRLIEG